MARTVPDIIAEGLDSEIIPGTLGVRTGIYEAKNEEQEHPNEIFARIKALTPVLAKSMNNLARLIDLAGAGGSKEYVNEARKQAWEMSEVSEDLFEDLTALSDAIGLHKLKIR